LTRRLLFAAFATLLLIAPGGCSTLQGVRDYVAYNDCSDDFVIGWRNYVLASQAWHARSECFADQAQIRDFQEGFCAGYREASVGSDGCPPPLPPRKYWSWRYQSPEGQAKVAAWYAGYPQGAAAAEEDGTGNWREIQVSDSIQTQYSPEFQRGMIPNSCGGCYPQQVPPDWQPPATSPPSSTPVELQPRTAPPAPQYPDPAPLPPGGELRTDQANYIPASYPHQGVRLPPMEEQQYPFSISPSPYGF
jgi:hypothetical protein